MSTKLIDIDHLSDLARISLTEEEKTAIAPQLETILSYVGRLAEVDTSGVSEAAYVTDAVNVFREDVGKPCDEAVRLAVIAAFPKKVGTALEVPGMFDERTE